MGSQGLPPGGQTQPEEQSRLEAAGTVLGVVAAFLVALVIFVYIGGWAAHVLVDIARSGWGSK